MQIKKKHRVIKFLPDKFTPIQDLVDHLSEERGAKQSAPKVILEAVKYMTDSTMLEGDEEQ